MKKKSIAIKYDLIQTVIIILTLMIFILDIMIPLGVAFGVLYSTIIILAIKVYDKYLMLVLATALTFLTILGFYLSPHGGELWKVLFNRSLSIFLIWVITGIVLKRKRLEEKNNALYKVLQDERNMFLDGPVIILKWQNKPGWPVEYISANVESLLGYSVDEFLNREIVYFDIISDEFKENVKEEVERYSSKKAKNISHRPYEIMKKNGQKIFVSDFTSIIYNEKGEISHYLGFIIDISKNIKTERALKKYKLHLDTLFDKHTDAIFIAKYNETGNSKFIEVNDVACSLLGFTREELLSLSPMDISRPVDIFDNPIDIKDITLKIKQNGSTIFLAIQTTKSGELIPVEIISHVMELDGELAVASVVRDIRERKLTEKAIVESETKFRTLANYATDWEYWIMPNGQYKYISPSCKEISGYTAQEFQENPKLFLDIIHLDFKSIMSNRLRLDNDSSQDKSKTELMITTKSGENKWLEHVCTPIFDNSGTFLGRRGTLSDITRRKEYEVQLKKFHILVEQSPFTIVITDLSGNIEYANPYFENSTGYSVNDAIGKNVKILKSGMTDPKVYTELWQTITKGDIWKGEFQNVNKKGDYYWESVTITPLKNQQNEVFQYLAIKEDITEKKLLVDQLYQSQKMESIGQFAGGIAHDFNNILTAIMGFTEIGLLDNKDDMILNNVQSSAERAAHLVKKLLGFSRKQIIDPVVLDIKQLIDDLEKILNRMIGDDINIIKSYKNTLPLLFADPGQIEQILVNLVVNARDAINSRPDKDNQRLITMNLESVILTKDKHEELYTIPAGRYLIISVADTGTGIDTETKKKIFDPFFTTKEEGKGTGLGLSTVFGIIEQNKGFITVDSIVGKGTQFNIFWPVMENNMNENEKEIVKETAITGSETIVIVEDDVDIISMVESGLKKLGYTIIAFSDPEKALRAITHFEGKIDIIITDVIMPKMDGKTLIDNVLKSKPDLKVLYVSGYTDDHIVNAGILKKDVNFIAKPYNLIELTKKIKTIVYPE